MPRKPELTDQLFRAYGEACGWASMLELKMRILADNTPALREWAHANSLQDVETAIVKEFAARLQSGDADLLEKSRFLRNKVVHGNFSKAKEILIGLGYDVPNGGVMDVPLDMAAAGGSIVAAIHNAVPARVADTSTKDGHIFGWLLECGGARIFPTAIEVFRKATDIVERLLEEDS